MPPANIFSPTRTAAIVARAAESSLTAEQSRGPIGGYVPIIWPAVVGLAVYGLLGAGAFFFFMKFGKRWFLVLPISLVCMAIGFCIRIASRSTDSVGVYAIQQLFLLLSPCGFIAAIYIALVRISYFLGEDVGRDCFFIRPTRVVRIFVWCDVISFVVQASGGGMTAVQSMASTGEKLSLVGLILQLCCFSLFCILLVVFGFRLRSMYPQKWANSKDTVGNFKPLYLSLFPICFAVYVRCVFRIAEFVQGYEGYLRVHEGYFYLLDALPLALAMVFFLIFWPPRVLPFDMLPANTTGLELEQTPGSDVYVYNTSPKGSV